MLLDKQRFKKNQKTLESEAFRIFLSGSDSRSPIESCLHRTPKLETFICAQWCTQKIFMGGFHSVAHGGHLYLVCAVCDVVFIFSSEVF